MITTTTKTRPTGSYRERKEGKTEEYTESTIEGTVTEIRDATVTANGSSLTSAVASVATADGEIVTVCIGHAFFDTKSREVLDIPVGSHVTATLTDATNAADFDADSWARITTLNGVA